MSESRLHQFKRVFPALIHRMPLIESAINYSHANTINGKKMVIPVLGGIGESLLRIEADFKSELLKGLVGIVSDVFIDVGANIGQTLVEACSVRDWRTYIAIEPSPECCAYLRALCLANDLRAVQILPWACAEEASPLRLYRSSEVDASATASNERASFLASHRHSAWIASYSIDQIVNAYEMPKTFFLKIDVEGFEASVLAGARRVLSEFRPLIQCEVLRAFELNQLQQVDANMSALESLLAACNYVALEIRLSAETAGKIVALNKISKFPRPLYSESPSGIDYLFVPDELLSRVVSRFA